MLEDLWAQEVVVVTMSTMNQPDMLSMTCMYQMQREIVQQLVSNLSVTPFH